MSYSYHGRFSPLAIDAQAAMVIWGPVTGAFGLVFLLVVFLCRCVITHLKLQKPAADDYAKKYKRLDAPTCCAFRQSLSSIQGCAIGYSICSLVITHALYVLGIIFPISGLGLLTGILIIIYSSWLSRVVGVLGVKGIVKCFAVAQLTVGIIVGLFMMIIGSGLLALAIISTVCVRCSDILYVMSLVEQGALLLLALIVVHMILSAFCAAFAWEVATLLRSDKKQRILLTELPALYAAPVGASPIMYANPVNAPYASPPGPVMFATPGNVSPDPYGALHASPSSNALAGPVMYATPVNPDPSRVALAPPSPTANSLSSPVMYATPVNVTPPTANGALHASPSSDALPGSVMYATPVNVSPDPSRVALAPPSPMANSLPSPVMYATPVNVPSPTASSLPSPVMYATPVNVPSPTGPVMYATPASVPSPTANSQPMYATPVNGSPAYGVTPPSPTANSRPSPVMYATPVNGPSSWGTLPPPSPTANSPNPRYATLNAPSQVSSASPTLSPPSPTANSPNPMYATLNAPYRVSSASPPTANYQPNPAMYATSVFLTPQDGSSVSNTPLLPPTPDSRSTPNPALPPSLGVSTPAFTQQNAEPLMQLTATQYQQFLAMQQFFALQQQPQPSMALSNPVGQNMSAPSAEWVPQVAEPTAASTVLSQPIDSARAQGAEPLPQSVEPLPQSVEPLPQSVAPLPEGAEAEPHSVEG